MVIPKSADEVQDLLFGPSKKPVINRSFDQSILNESQKPSLDVLKSIEAETFALLQRNGYTREQTIDIVANFITNLNRVSQSKS